jgi:hypothetical protein
LLSQVVASEDEGLKDTIWDILVILPHNKNIVAQIQTLQVDGSDEAWSKLLSSRNYRRLLYCLLIVQELQSRNEVAEKWN